MNRLSLLSNLALVVGFLLSVTPTKAAPQTFVSGTGGGATCSLASPCADFQTAHDATDAGGEIICVNTTVQTGPLTITKSIIIDCTQTFGQIVALPGGNAININTPGIRVFI